MSDLLLEPLKFYETQGKALCAQNAAEHFDALLSQSGIDEAQNRRTVAAYQREDDLYQGVNRKRKFLCALRVLCIIFAVVGVLLTVMGLVWIGLLSTVAFVCLWLFLLNPKIRNLKQECQARKEKKEQLQQQAWQQMAPLNALFSATDTLRLIEKTVPQISFAPRYEKELEHQFRTKYDFFTTMNEQCTVVDTLSGTLCKNPFLFCRYRRHEMKTHLYTGTLTISWVEYYRDSDGRRRSRRRTQVLTASVVKPKPEYTYQTILHYGCQAAPDLTFSRTDTDVEKWSEKKIAREIRQGEEELRKRSEKSVREGGSFQAMTNSEFEVLFGAQNRNHEVQFRLMYTPLGQNNTVDLIRNQSGYGDDFDFYKRKRCNIIMTEHAQNWSMAASPREYETYDIDQAKKRFLDFHNEYFKSIFFDFAPLLCVPAYQEAPVKSMESPAEYDSYFTSYEYEAVANAFGTRIAHSTTKTDVIYKTRLLKKEAEHDRVLVTARSYRTESRVELVPVLGGDGRMHAVPVPWIEYLPVERETVVTMRKEPYSVKDHDPNYIGYHGIYAQAQHRSDML